jgi:hypothetical protein
MTAQIMRSEFDPYQFSGFNHHHPGGFIGNRNTRLLWALNTFSAYPRNRSPDIQELFSPIRRHQIDMDTGDGTDKRTMELGKTLIPSTNRNPCGRSRARGIHGDLSNGVFGFCTSVPHKKHAATRLFLSDLPSSAPTVGLTTQVHIHPSGLFLRSALN